MFQIALFLKERLLGRTTFDVDEVRIGRSADNEICIDNLGLSRYHASIESVEGVEVLRDFSSQNGTYVNGDKIVGRRALNDGDRITIGKFTLVYRRDTKKADKATIRDEASYAIAGHTMVLAQPGADVLERGCPFVGYVEHAIGGKAAIHNLVRDVTVIGSARDCALVLPEPAVKRGAALVRGWRGFSLLPLGPGVKKNGTNIEQVASLRNGDSFAVGTAAFTFRLGRPETA